MISLAPSSGPRYRSVVAANSATDLGRSNQVGAQAPITRLQALFLCSQFRVMAAVRGTPSGVPVSYLTGRPTRVQLSPFLAWPRAVAVPQIGAPSMHTRTPSALLNRAAAHRAMAMSALGANSSLASRLARYNRHMTIARGLQALEAKGGVQ